jgi:hypothetical protein
LLVPSEHDTETVQAGTGGADIMGHVRGVGLHQLNFRARFTRDRKITSRAIDTDCYP